MECTNSDFSARMTDAVKAELARRHLSGRHLVVPLKMGRNAVYARLRHEKAFSTEELDQIAGYLGISVDLILESARLSERAAV